MNEMLGFFKWALIICAIIGGSFYTYNHITADDVYANTIQSNSGGVSQDNLAKEIHNTINEHRKIQGLKSLAFDLRLSSIAQQHSENMVKQDLLSHDLNGKNHVDRFKANNYHCKVMTGQNSWDLGGENILSYSGTMSANDIVELWIDSPSHRSNLETRYWENSGVGIASNGNAVFVTQNFC